MNPGRARSTSTPSTQRVQDQLRQTTCLLCYTPVNINVNLKNTVSSPEDLERRKWVQNLCNYRGIKLLIPECCSETKFPFCEDCKQRLEQLSFHWENLEVTFNGIESEVADGEIRRMSFANPGMLPTDDELEKEKCSVLRDVLLEGYRIKLRAKRKQRSTMQLQMNDSFPVLSSPGSIPDLRRVSSSSCSSSNMVPQRNMDLRCEEADTTIGTDWRDEDYEEDDVYGNDDDNDNGSCLRISDIRTVSCDSEIDSGNAIGVTIRGSKQKLGGNLDQNDQVGPGESGDDDEIFELAVTHRRMQCGGIEIFRVLGNGNGANATPDSLQCGHCNFTVPDKISYGRNGTPLQQMKAHIRVAHLGENTPDSITTPRNIVPNDQYFGEMHTCDICDRPVRGAKSMLKQHKFFHMNDAERQAAVDAGLKGMYTSKRLANKKYPMPTGKSSMKKAVPSSPKKKAVASTSKKKAVASSSRTRSLPPLDRDEKKYVYKCYNCEKLFPNERSLVVHARRHAPRGSYARKRSGGKSVVKREDHV
ncbi:unnamed protein product [Orchesella dallaii]|uniref:C2H2-type domain-containing protein n=1 Tax=Orchesella dallaii TaxID=48710 RepID=A0ABP1R5Z2_9HEXA